TLLSFPTRRSSDLCPTRFQRRSQQQHVWRTEVLSQRTSLPPPPFHSVFLLSRQILRRPRQASVGDRHLSCQTRGQTPRDPCYRRKKCSFGSAPTQARLIRIAAREPSRRSQCAAHDRSVVHFQP